MTELPISVIIPTYNRVQYIAQSIESILVQLAANDEVLVIDDGSTDATAAIVRTYLRDPRCRYIRKKHTGAPDTRNRGIREAKHRWLLWLDSDDLLLPGTVAAYKKYIARFPDVDVFYGDLMIVENGKRDRVVRYDDHYQHNDALIAGLIEVNQIPNPGTLVHSRVYRRYGMYDTTFPRAHDYEFWCRIAKKAVFKHIGRSVCRYQWHTTNLSAGSVAYDTQYESRIVDGMLDRYSLRSLFPQYSWEKGNDRATAQGYHALARIYLRYNDVKKSLHYGVRSLVFCSSGRLTTVAECLLKTRDCVRYAKKIPPAILERVLCVAKEEKPSIMRVYHAASLNKKVGRDDQATRLFAMLVERLKGSKKYHALLGKCFFHLGELALSHREHVRAKMFFRRCLALEPAHRKAQDHMRVLIGRDTKG